MLEIVLASQNHNKLAEIQELLRDLKIKFIPQAEFSVPDIEEMGSTFIENAIIKARHAAKQTGLPALADDSGLTVAALNSAPGVFYRYTPAKTQPMLSGFKKYWKHWKRRMPRIVARLFIVLLR